MSPALEIFVRIWMALFWLLVIGISCALVFAFWLLIGAPLPLRARRLINSAPVSDPDPGDVNDYDTARESAPPRRRGIARAEGLGPRILGRKSSALKLGLPFLDESARRAIEEVMRTAGGSR